MKLASALLESTSESELSARSAPAFLVNLEPWHRVFFRNLADLFRPRKQTPFLISSRPGSFWPDVFVASRLPWNRFAQSAVCHVAVIVALWGSVRFWPQPPQVLNRPVSNRDDVIYYAPSEYLPPLDTGGPRRPLPRKGEPEHAAQPIISVPAEADNQTQTIVTPSGIKINHDVPLPNIVAWSQKAQPAVPLASTADAAKLRLPALPVAAVAPAPETMPANGQRSPMLSQSVVAPVPELNNESSRTLRGPQLRSSNLRPAWTPRRSAAWGTSTSDTRRWSRPRRSCPSLSNMQHPAGRRRRLAARARRRWRRHLRFRAVAVRVPVAGSSLSAFTPRR